MDRLSIRRRSRELTGAEIQSLKFRSNEYDKALKHALDKGLDGLEDVAKLKHNAASQVLEYMSKLDPESEAHAKAASYFGSLYQSAENFVEDVMARWVADMYGLAEAAEEPETMRQMGGRVAEVYTAFPQVINRLSEDYAANPDSEGGELYAQLDRIVDNEWAQRVLDALESDEEVFVPIAQKKMNERVKRQYGLNHLAEQDIADRIIGTSDAVQSVDGKYALNGFVVTKQDAEADIERKYALNGLD